MSEILCRWLNEEVGLSDYVGTLRTRPPARARELRGRLRRALCLVIGAVRRVGRAVCGRGDLEVIDGLRADSPTAEIEAHNVLFSYAAANKLDLKTADISNAYF